ncbi:hypothetical protein [Streptomyces viridosporus]|uniref:hypothetical protein n=1 Tax=Streptomyces viridosporus TaxID=67581 RepID=UPI0009BE199D|nr:hypothetical protein [Streptomyces viridosporus]
MGERTLRERDGRDDDRLSAELEEEITSWLEQGGMHLLAALDGRGASDETTARRTIRDLVQQDGFGGAGTVDRSSEPLGRGSADSDVRWSNLVATYLDYLSSSLLPHTGDGGRTRSFGLDEGHAGGCG